MIIGELKPTGTKATCGYDQPNGVGDFTDGTRRCRVCMDIREDGDHCALTHTCDGCPWGKSETQCTTTKRLAAGHAQVHAEATATPTPTGVLAPEFDPEADWVKASGLTVDEARARHEEIAGFVAAGAWLLGGTADR